MFLSFLHISQVLHPTVTQKGNAPQVWKVAVAGFLFLGTDSIFCLGVKTELILEMYVYPENYRYEFRVKEWRAKELAVPS